MTKVEQGVNYLLLPAITFVAAHRITRNIDVATATALGTFGLAYGIRNHPEMTVQVLRPTVAALAVGTLLYLATEKIEASVPLGALAGFGTSLLWSKDSKKEYSQPRVLAETPEEVLEQLQKVQEKAGDFDKNDISEVVRDLLIAKEGLSYLNGAAKQIKDEATEIMQLVDILVGSYAQDHSIIVQAMKDNITDQEMHEALEKNFNFIKVDDDGSCAAHAALALVDTEMKAPELRQKIQEYVRAGMEGKDKDHISFLVMMSLLSAKFVAEENQQGRVSPLFRKAVIEDKKEVCPDGKPDIELYCQAINDTQHWFDNSELQMMAEILGVSIGVYTGKPIFKGNDLILDDNYRFSCGKEDAKWIYLWNAQAEGHYYALDPKKEV